jgi:hypothetical protein
MNPPVFRDRRCNTDNLNFNTDGKQVQACGLGRDLTIRQYVVVDTCLDSL